MAKCFVSGIYRIFNIVNGKSYVGSSVNIKNRLKVHFSKLKAGKSHTPKLQNAYNKYSVDGFKTEIIELCELEHLAERERHWIEYYDSVESGYNHSYDTTCATRGMKWNDEQKKRASDAQKMLNSPSRSEAARLKIISYNKSLVGKPKSDDHKSKISAGNIGKVRTSEQRQKNSQYKKENPVNYWLGKKRSKEDKAKISAAHIGKSGSLHPRSKPIIQCDESGKKINEFASATEAAVKLCINRTSIRDCINNPGKTFNGFTFKNKKNALQL